MREVLSEFSESEIPTSRELLEELGDTDHAVYGKPRALFNINTAIQSELKDAYSLFYAEFAKKRPNWLNRLPDPQDRLALRIIVDQETLVAKEFYKERGSGLHYDSYCKKYRSMAASFGVLENFQPEELTYFRMACSNIFQEMYGLDVAMSVVPEDLPRLPNRGAL